MKHQHNTSHFQLIHLLLILVGLLCAPSLSFAQPTEINVSGCGNNFFNGNYNRVASMCNSCNNYEKVGGGANIYRYSTSGIELWSGTLGSVDCASIVYAMQSNETNCDPTDGATQLDGCVFNSGLPVELIFFKGNPLEKSIQLEWKVASEINNAGFELQRSTDGRNFEYLEFIEGRGTTSEAWTYTFDDQAILANQQYYYRLRQVDFDDRFEYSEIISATLQSAISYASTFFPNPTVGHTSIELFSQASTEWKISFYDLSGKLIFKELHQLNRGANTLSFDLTAYPNGLYHVQFESPDAYFFKKLSIQD